MKKYLSLALALLICLALSLPAGAQDNSGRAALLNSIVEDSNLYAKFYEKSRGTVEIEVVDLTGADAGIFTAFKNSKLVFDYLLNSPANKLGLGIKLNTGGKTAGGDVYITESRLIVSRDLFQLANLFTKGQIPAMNSLPEYLYSDVAKFNLLFKSLFKNAGAPLTPDAADLLGFFIEAVPDKYIQVAGGKVTLQFDQQGFSEILYSIIQKIQQEPDRFAGHLSKTMAAYGGTTGDIKSDILKTLQSRQLTISAAEINQSLSDAGINLSDFVYTQPIGKNGPSTMKVNVSINDKTSGKQGKIEYSLSQDRAGDSTAGRLLTNLAIKDKDLDFSLSLQGGYKLSPEKYSADYTCNGLMAMPGVPAIGASLKLSSRGEADDNVQINIPALTPANSIDMNSLGSGRLRVTLNGRPLKMDVQPFIKDGRTMVPARNLAEPLGCRVSAAGPNQVHIAKGDKLIILYLGENRYTVDGEDKTIDVAPFVMDGRTMVPVRFVAEEMGCQVIMKGNTVEVTS